MSIKYYIQKWLGGILKSPLIPRGKTVGYSLVRSERYQVEQGTNTKVYPPFFLHEVKIGDYSYIAKDSSISHCTIGKFCSIGPHFCCGLGIHPTTGVSTAPMFYSTAKQNGVSLCSENKVQEFLQTTIGNDVFIGANVTVLDGVTIGDGAVIGAGAVVTKDIPPYGIAVGVPAHVVKYRFEDTVIQRLQRKEWWNGSLEDVQRVEQYFWDVEQFLSGTK